MMDDLNEFKKYPKTKRFLDSTMLITEKLEGTNAQIVFLESETPNYIPWLAGSRNKWLTETSSNFGFYQFVEENVEVLFEILGVGRHYGEFCGDKIQNTAGVEGKKLFMFNTSLDIPEEYKHIVDTVPRLHVGPFNPRVIHEILNGLKDNGSVASPGFYPVEGIILHLSSKRYKIYLDNIDDIAKMIGDDNES